MSSNILLGVISTGTGLTFGYWSGLVLPLSGTSLVEIGNYGMTSAANHLSIVVELSLYKAAVP